MKEEIVPFFNVDNQKGLENEWRGVKSLPMDQAKILICCDIPRVV